MGQMWNASAGFQGHGIIPFEIPGTDVQNLKRRAMLVARKNEMLASEPHHRCEVPKKQMCSHIVNDPHCVQHPTGAGGELASECFEFI